MTTDNNSTGERKQPPQNDPAEDFQKAIMAAQDMKAVVASTGRTVSVSPEGGLRLVHGTSVANKAAILAEGRFHAGSYFAGSKVEAMYNAYPKHLNDVAFVEVTIDARALEFSTGTGEFFASEPLERIGRRWCSTLAIASDHNAPPSVSEDDLTAFFQTQIEDGNFDAEGMARRLARFGLADPVDFQAEMQERMELYAEECAELDHDQESHETPGM